jgi:hypothetical protein
VRAKPNSFSAGSQPMNVLSPVTRLALPVITAVLILRALERGTEAQPATEGGGSRRS